MAHAAPDRAPDLAALAWQIELGADEAIGETPVDRFERAEPAAVQASPTRAAPVAAAAPAAVAPLEAGAADLAAGCADLAALRATLGRFEGSALRLGARNLVFSDGDPRSRLMVIGEAPGRDEDLAGLPFVGPSGQLLDRMLAAIGLSRKAADPAFGAYITNVLPWRPPQNRDPSGDEAALLLPFLFRHIELARPEVLLLLGSPAVRAVLATTDGVTRMRGRWFDWRGVPVIATWHPAALLRDASKKRDAWADLLQLKARLGG
ncbi:MAG: uracil-DNA glycosylase [Amaricoccus sp.]